MPSSNARIERFLLRLVPDGGVAMELISGGAAPPETVIVVGPELDVPEGLARETPILVLTPSREHMVDVALEKNLHEPGAWLTLPNAVLLTCETETSACDHCTVLQRQTDLLEVVMVLPKEPTEWSEMVKSGITNAMNRRRVALCTVRGTSKRVSYHEARNWMEIDGSVDLKPYPDGTQGLIVSASPTLNEAMPFLKGWAESRPIIAVDAAIPALRKNGIMPDVICTIEPKDDKAKIISELWAEIENGAENPPVLVISDYANPAMFAAWGGDKMLVTTYGAWPAWVKTLKEPSLTIPDIGESFTVANMALSLAYNLNLRPVLIGCDCSLPYGKQTHADGAGSSYDLVKVAGDIHHIPSEDGGMVPCIGGQSGMVTIFEERILRAAQRAKEAGEEVVPPIRVVDQKKRVARISGCEVVTVGGDDPFPGVLPGKGLEGLRTADEPRPGVYFEPVEADVAAQRKLLEELREQVVERQGLVEIVNHPVDTLMRSLFVDECYEIKALTRSLSLAKRNGAEVVIPGLQKQLDRLHGRIMHEAGEWWKDTLDNVLAADDTSYGRLTLVEEGVA